MLTSKRLHVRMMFLAGLGMAGLGGVALAATSGRAGVSVSRFAAGQRSLVPTAVTPDQASFAILRRPVTAVDAGALSSLPSSATGLYGANVNLARRAQGLPPGIDAWVVPGSGSLCLVTRSYNGACGSDSAALNGNLYVVSGGARTPGMQFIAGLVPDGVGIVTLALSDGSEQDVPVGENVYVASVRGSIDHVSYDSAASGAVTLDHVAP